MIAITILSLLLLICCIRLLQLENMRSAPSLPRNTPEPVLTSKGPHTVELLPDLYVYQLPIPRLQESVAIKISLLVPSRSRPDLLRKSLNTVMDHATERGSLQIIIRCDSDDDYMTDFTFPECPNLKIIRGQRMKGYGSLHFFYTECALHASGALLLLWNDDAQMMTPGWDRQLWSETARVREQGLHGFWALSNNHWPYAFPVITRSITERLGAFARFSYNDAYLYQLARSCSMEQPVLESILVQHDMPPDSGWDGKSFDLYNAGFFQEIIDGDAKLLTQ